MDKMRFLEVDWLSYAQTAIFRPVLMRAVSEGVVPETVSFCRFSVPSLVLTYLNDPEKEIDLPFCKKNNLPVYRVIASGGPIFGDTGYAFTFLHLKRDNPKVPANASEMFEKTLTGVARGIAERFNIDCRFRPLNDVEVKCDDGKWRKIGPCSCVFEEKAVQLGSGIQVKAPDADLIASAITAPPEKFADKATKTIQDRITYLEKAVGRSVGLIEIRDVYVDQVRKIFETELVPGQLSEQELKYFEEMEQEYTDETFFMERSEKKLGPMPRTVIRKSMQFKVPGGPFVRIIAFVEANRLKDLLITGHFHASPLRPTSPIHEIENALRGQLINRDLFESEIERILARDGFHIAGTNAQFLARKIYDCTQL